MTHDLNEAETRAELIDPSIKELDDLKVLLEAPKDEILDIFKLEGYDPHPAIKGKVAV